MLLVDYHLKWKRSSSRSFNKVYFQQLQKIYVIIVYNLDKENFVVENPHRLEIKTQVKCVFSVFLATKIIRVNNSKKSVHPKHQSMFNLICVNSWKIFSSVAETIEIWKEASSENVLRRREYKYLRCVTSEKQGLGGCLRMCEIAVSLRRRFWGLISIVCACSKLNNLVLLALLRDHFLIF